MTQEQIYQNIARRTGGDIYIGVVGPVRTGKSTFIKRFSELLLLPHIQNEAQRARANDELPAKRRRPHHHDHRAEVHPGEGGQYRAFRRRQLPGTAYRLRGLHGGRCPRP